MLLPSTSEYIHNSMYSMTHAYIFIEGLLVNRKYYENHMVLDVQFMMVNLENF